MIKPFDSRAKMAFITAALLALQAPLTPACPKEAPTATTLNGTYTGRHVPSLAQDFFLGIPYAAAPRLRDPVPIDESWTGVRPAEYYGPACWSQAYEGYLLHVNVTSMSEECLNLNIIRPSAESLSDLEYRDDEYDDEEEEEEAGDVKLPVAVWLHGGGFAVGFGADSTTNMSYIVQESVAQGMPIMAVTLNYRLGFLGFPGGEEVAAEGVTNLGLKDQRQALRWIRENIAAFGGDPEKVTLWGQSAGSASIAYQILAYGGDTEEEEQEEEEERLFRGGIMVSGTASGPNTLHPLRDDCLQGYEDIVNATGCLDADDSLACLREVPIEDLFEATLGLGTFPTWWPMVDGDFVAEPPLFQLLEGRVPKGISILGGSNNDEGLISALAFGPEIDTDEELYQLLRDYFPFAKGETLELVMETYPLDGPGPPYSLAPEDERFCEAMVTLGLPCGRQFRRVAAIFGDYAQINGHRTISRKFAELGLTAYLYRFDTNPTTFPTFENGFVPGFATHSAEYSYFFRHPESHDTLGLAVPVADSESHLALSHAIAAKLISYIYTGDPNAFEVPSVPFWPKYSVDEPRNMVFNATESPDELNIHVESDTWRAEGMALWEANPIELELKGTLPPIPGS